MQVPASALDAHLAHGDQLGACEGEQPSEPEVPEETSEKVTICHKPGTNAEQTLIVSTSALEAHLAHGDYVGTCGGEPTEQPDAPGQGAEKVTICHKPGTSAERTLIVSASALEAHLAHGDYVGTCSGEPTEQPDAPGKGAEKVIICHKPGTNAERTLIVSVAALEAHLAHGDYIGECDGRPVEVFKKPFRPHAGPRPRAC
jgi:hypothetical protein